MDEKIDALKFVQDVRLTVFIAVHGSFPFGRQAFAFRGQARCNLLMKI